MEKVLREDQKTLVKKPGIKTGIIFLEKRKMSSLTKFQSSNSTMFILCDCKSEILVIDYDSEIKMADLSIYESHASFSYKMSFWQKIRYIWRVLYRGKPYTDQIILNKEQLLQLKDYIDQIV